MACRRPRVCCSPYGHDTVKDRHVYRPPIILRLLLGALGGIGGVGAVWQVILWARQGPALHLAAAAVVSLPFWLALNAGRVRVEVTEEGLRWRSLTGERAVPWTGVRRLDQTRRSFVAVTEAGLVSAGWLARGERDRLMRQILQRAKLMARAGKLRWRLVAQYAPRAQRIDFQGGSPKGDRLE